MVGPRTGGARIWALPLSRHVVRQIFDFREQGWRPVPISYASLVKDQNCK